MVCIVSKVGHTPSKLPADSLPAMAELSNVLVSRRDLARLDEYCHATERTRSSALRYMIKCHLDEWEESLDAGT